MSSGKGKLFYDAGKDIWRDDFANGAYMCKSSYHFHVVQRRNLAVDIKFSTAPTDAVSLVCYSENTIHIYSTILVNLENTIHSHLLLFWYSG